MRLDLVAEKLYFQDFRTKTRYKQGETKHQERSFFITECETGRTSFPKMIGNRSATDHFRVGNRDVCIANRLMELAVSHLTVDDSKRQYIVYVLSEDTRQRSGIGHIYRNEKINAEREWYCIPKRSVIFDAMFAHGEQICIDHSRVKREEEKVSVRAKVMKLCFP